MFLINVSYTQWDEVALALGTVQRYDFVALSSELHEERVNGTTLHKKTR